MIIQQRDNDRVGGGEGGVTADLEDNDRAGRWTVIQQVGWLVT